jgi:4-amino-4-deoxy-L-arabinose transferase-like glycosyltransferase
LIPLVFFTFARNIIYPYVFPSLPPLAVGFATILHRIGFGSVDEKRLVRLTAICGYVFVLLTVVFCIKPVYVAKSQDRMVAAWQEQHPVVGSALIYWTYRTDYSAQFYSKGLATAAFDDVTLCRQLSNGLVNYVVTDSTLRPVPEIIWRHLTSCRVITVLKKQYTLYRADVIKPDDCATH